MLAVNLDLGNKTVLVAGYGAVGRRKFFQAKEAGAARLKVLEPKPSAELLALAAAGTAELYAEFSPTLWDGVSLAFIATSDTEENKRLAREARARGIWVNAAENPADGDFFLPAVVARGDLQITVSTGGGGPALSAVVAEKLRGEFGPEYGRLAALLASLRPLVLSSALSADARRAVFRALSESDELLNFLADYNAPAIVEYVEGLLPFVPKAHLKELIAGAGL